MDGKHVQGASRQSGAGDESFTRMVQNAYKNFTLNVQTTHRSDVVETPSVVARRSDDGSKFINQYMVISSLGR